MRRRACFCLPCQIYHFFFLFISLLPLQNIAQSPKTYSLIFLSKAVLSASSPHENSDQYETCIHRSSLLIEHMPGLKSQSCLFTLPWIYTQALAYAHSLAHLSATVSPCCKQSMVCFALTPWGKHSLTLISCGVAFPVGWIDSLAVNQRRQVWFVVPQSPAPWPCGCLEGAASTRPPWCECVWWENTVATHELDSCIVLKDCRC